MGAAHDNDTDRLLGILDETAAAVTGAIAAVEDWGLSGAKAGQYLADVASNDVAVEVLTGNGLGVLSEETGLHHPERPLLAVLDPLDGSTNASRGIPWYATSICVLDAEGPLVALVVNQASGTRFAAVRGGGATCDGAPLRVAPGRPTTLGSSLIGMSGYPPRHLGWRQFRSLGAAALDLCAVASGLIDAYVDCVGEGMHGPWDYLGGALVCAEAGALAVDAFGRDLVVREHGPRRCPTAAATPELLDELVAARRTFS